jgi:hypothetical protein
LNSGGEGARALINYGGGEDAITSNVTTTTKRRTRTLISRKIKRDRKLKNVHGSRRHHDAKEESKRQKEKKKKNELKNEKL